MDQTANVVAPRSEDPKLITRVINFELVQPICPGLPVYQRHGLTDGRLTIAIPCQHYVHRAVKSLLANRIRLMLTEKVLNIAKNLAAVVIVNEQFHQPLSTYNTTIRACKSYCTKIMQANRDRGSDDDLRQSLTCALRFQDGGYKYMACPPLTRKRGEHVPCVPPCSSILNRIIQGTVFYGPFCSKETRTRNKLYN